MAELRNVFSWSFSAAADFEECRRRRYWSKYAAWGGWREEAPLLARTAYRLNKMQNGYTLLGNAVDTAARQAIRQQQEGHTVTADGIYQTVARPFLNQAWKESRDGLWRANPKKYTCLREHYYRQIEGEAQKPWVAYITEQTQTCLANFVATVLPRLKDVRREQEIGVATVADGDPESFELEGVKIYAIPDYVYRVGDDLHLHDWKAGKPRAEHRDQMLLYALWAHRKYGVAPAHVRLFLEYLAAPAVEEAQVSAAGVEAVSEEIGVSIGDMSEYLVDGDRERNEPLPQAEWDLATERTVCRQCNFYELCRPELEGGG